VARLSLPAQRPKTQKTKLSKNFVPFRSVAPAFASHQPIGRFETLAVAACSQNHSLTCESAVISGRVTLAGPVPASTSFSSFCRSFFSKPPRTFCRSPARFAALDLSSVTSTLQHSPGLPTEPKTDPFEPAFTSFFSRRSRFRDPPLSRRGGIHSQPHFWVNTFSHLFCKISAEAWIHAARAAFALRAQIPSDLRPPS
jgi:hypothetical protein